jgi:excisionase family DNA binding protein
MPTGALKDVPAPRRRSNPPQRPNAPGPTLLGLDAVAEWLGVEVVFVRRLVAERRIPFVKIGKFVRFDPAEVSAWIDGQRVKPVHRSSGVRSHTRG